MRFEWDEDKRQANIAKHRIDFLRARDAFDGRSVYEYPSSFPDEARRVTVARIGSGFIAVVWMWRDDDLIRIISARSARDGERRKYRLLHG
jgi:uncharacterized DUF497 family protein